MNDERIEQPASRGQVFRTLVIFQIKLAVDGLKDIVLAPVSLIAGLIGMFTNRGMEPLHAVLRLGRSFDKYIDLYSAIEEPKADVAEGDRLDDQLLRVEKALWKESSTPG